MITAEKRRKKIRKRGGSIITGKQILWEKIKIREKEKKKLNNCKYIRDLLLAKFVAYVAAVTSGIPASRKKDIHFFMDDILLSSTYFYNISFICV